MLYIEKKTASRKISRMIAQVRSTPGWKTAKDTKAVRGFFDMLDKQMLRDSIVPEQHGLCAYCMRRINTDGHTTVEHFVPLSKSKAKALQYKNFLCVCDGGQEEIKKKEVPSDSECCDRAKGDGRALFLNPQNEQIMQGIRYEEDGSRITYKGSNQNEAHNELNKVLKLNGILNPDGTLRYDTATGVIKGRRDAYATYDSIVKKHRAHLTSAVVQGEIDRIKAMPVYPEYAGVILYYLERKRKTLAAQGK